tara:strand:- start:205 stop:387 length:183 start_codon:yes stop_codon:yes gene_type:complete
MLDASNNNVTAVGDIRNDELTPTPTGELVIDNNLFYENSGMPDNEKDNQNSSRPLNPQSV